MEDVLALLLADTSALHRSIHPLIRPRWQTHLAENRIAITAPVKLEFLYSTQSVVDYDEVAFEMEALHQLECGESAFKRALSVQRDLAHQGGLHHRSVKISDLLIAAVAELSAAIVWHYDEDFDRIAAITGQRTQWIAPRGSL